jgi:hypothetical protein
MQSDFARQVEVIELILDAYKHQSVWDFRGDAVGRMEAFRDSEEAVAAAGEDVDASDH